MRLSPSRNAFAVLTTRVSSLQRHTHHPAATLVQQCALQRSQTLNHSSYRSFVTTTPLLADKSHAQTAKELNQKGLDEHESGITDSISQEKEKQIRTPWHREGSNVPPVGRQRSAGAMTKGIPTPLLRWVVTLPLLISARQITHYPISATQTHIASHDPGQKFRSERY